MTKRYEHYKDLVIKELLFRCRKAKGRIVSVKPRDFSITRKLSPIELTVIKKFLEELIAEGLGYKHITSAYTTYIFYKDKFLERYDNARTNQ